MVNTNDREQVRELAYRLWEERGRPDDRAQEHWFEAERRIEARRKTLSPANKASKAVDEASRESFPASDPPSSHIPDEPPVNAKAKWAAAAHTGRRKKGAPPPPLRG